MINKLEIKNWRNIQSFKLSFKKGVNIIIGPNGAGKTSILEAIFFCLTGKTHIPEPLQNLKRIDTDEKLFLKLFIQTNEKEIQIIREYQNLLRSYLYQNNFKIAKRKYEVDNYILNYYNINHNLFSNLIYSSEGEIYKFQNINERRDLIKYLEDILGFNKLTQFADVTKEINNFLNQEKKKLKIKKKQLKELQYDSDKTFQEIEQELVKYNKEMVDIKKELKKLYNQQGEIKQKIKNKKYILGFEIEQIEKIKKVIQELFSANSIDLNKINFYERKANEELEIIKDDLEYKKSSVKSKENFLREQKLVMKNIIDKLNDYKIVSKKDKKTILCPFCEKPLTTNQLEVLRNTSLLKKKEITKNIDELELTINQESEELALFQNRNSKLENFLTYIKTVKDLKDQYKSSIIKAEMKDLSDDLEILDNQIYKFEKSEKDARYKISNLDKNLIKISNSLKIKQLDDYDNNLNAADVGMLFGSIITKAINDTISIYKINLLKPLINEITSIWSEIFPEDTRQITIDKSFSPVFKYGDKYIDYNLLSSGEKILLLVILKTLMIKYFSTIPFLILDEPIEHLDEENRNIIIDYLFKIIQDGLIQQLIITTYEESIIRKFKDLKHVNIISLEALKKYPYSEETIIS